LAQYRLSSGTSATAMTAVDGSRCGIGATSTRPPPKRRRRLPVRLLPVRPDPPVRVDSALTAGRDTALGAASAPVARPVAGPAGADGAGVAAEPAAGAMPQVSQ
jgi:hypothetical protein